MNKFIKENWFKLGLLLALIIIVAAVAYHLIFDGQINNDAAPSAAGNSSPQESIECDQYTKGLFTVQLSKPAPAGGMIVDTTDASYQSHYNPVMQKCFGLINIGYYNPSIKKDYVSSTVLYDVYDNNIVASYTPDTDTEGMCVGSAGLGNSSGTLNDNCTFDEFAALVNADMQSNVFGN